MRFWCSTQQHGSMNYHSSQPMLCLHDYKYRFTMNSGRRVKLCMRSRVCVVGRAPPGVDRDESMHLRRSHNAHTVEEKFQSSSEEKILTVARRTCVPDGQKWSSVVCLAGIVCWLLNFYPAATTLLLPIFFCRRSSLYIGSIVASAASLIVIVVHRC
jgi:hypothetical protein